MKSINFYYKNVFHLIDKIKQYKTIQKSVLVKLKMRLLSIQ